MCPLYLSISASVVSKQSGPSKYMCDKARMLFHSTGESMFYIFAQSSAVLFTGQSSLHHQARHLTHPLLQWCCAAADTANYIKCLSVLVCFCLIVCAIVPKAFHEFVRSRNA